MILTGIHIANINGNVNSYLKDEHGNVIGKVNTLGEKQNVSYEYDAFGNQLEDEPDPFGYCGEYWDSESGLIYLRNRYYDSEIGRFINEDPIKDGLNWYGYCGGNPIIRVDPTGEGWTEIGKSTAIGAISGGAGGAATGAYLGYIGAPFTAGLSVGACAIVGGVSSAIGGAVTGFVAGVMNEVWK